MAADLKKEKEKETLALLENGSWIGYFEHPQTGVDIGLDNVCLTFGPPRKDTPNILVGKGVTSDTVPFSITGEYDVNSNDVRMNLKFQNPPFQRPPVGYPLSVDVIATLDATSDETSLSSKNRRSFYLRLLSSTPSLSVHGLLKSLCTLADGDRALVRQSAAAITKQFSKHRSLNMATERVMNDVLNRLTTDYHKRLQLQRRVEQEKEEEKRKEAEETKRRDGFYTQMIAVYDHHEKRSVDKFHVVFTSATLIKFMKRAVPQLVWHQEPPVHQVSSFLYKIRDIEKVITDSQRGALKQELHLEKEQPLKQELPLKQDQKEQPLEKDQKQDLALKQNDVTQPKQFHSFLRQHFASTVDPYSAMYKEGIINYEGLWWCFPLGSELVYNGPCNAKIGFILAELRIDDESVDFYGNVLVNCGEDGNHFIHRVFSIHPFSGTVKVDELAIHLITPALKDTLQKRGQQYFTIASAASGQQFSYNGRGVTNPLGKKETSLPLVGRVVADPTQYLREVDDYNYSFTSRSRRLPAIPMVQDLWRSWPWLSCFSLQQKKWMECDVLLLKPISASADAWDSLVLPERHLYSYRELLLTLINAHGKTGNDVIADKSCGTTILLHGPPGLGKTLTSEAVAHLLNLPLYMVTTGELGTSAKEIGANLQLHMKRCARWKGIMQLDEGDSLTETRKSGDLMGNSIISVLLTLFEYYAGILFMTTNRGGAIDVAVLSRFKCIIPFPPLTTEARASIWKKQFAQSQFYQDIKEEQLKRSLLDSTDWKSLSVASSMLNGRDIMNTVRRAGAYFLKPIGKDVQTILEAQLQVTIDGYASLKESNKVS